ncbi:MAG: flagellum-specific ATP synthase FliI, partial [Pirellulales bacterium]|nr:flagellum-specific ATP synthase FliI [Pirellulales bacterium]
REIGLAAGEPPTTRGYPPSVFALLPRLVERAGRSPKGSITAFYTVLVEGDDPNEPISDAVRGLLDGHVWLSRKLASKSHYPAVDVLESLSRLMPEVTTAEHRDAAVILRQLLAAYREHEDLISIGAYRRGSNPAVDVAIELQEPIRQYLTQRVEEPCSLEDARTGLLALKQQAAQVLGQMRGPSASQGQNPSAAQAGPPRPAPAASRT